MLFFNFFSAKFPDYVGKYFVDETVLTNAHKSGVPVCVYTIS